MTLDPDAIVARLDNEPLPREVGSLIAGQILALSKISDDLAEEALVRYREDFRDLLATERLKAALSKRRHASPSEQEFAVLSLAFCVCPGDGVLDGILAEYYYLWAEHVGIDSDIVSSLIIPHLSEP